MRRGNAAARLGLVVSVLLGYSITLSAGQVLSPAPSPAPKPAPLFNITTILDGFPDFTVLNQLLSKSGVAEEINTRRSVTLLAPNNDVLNAFQASIPSVDAVKIADLLRYHVLLQYFDLTEFKALDNVNGSAVTTLLQTTGRTLDTDGFVNIYNTPDGILIGHATPDTSPNVTVVKNVTQKPYDVSVMQIDKVLEPIGFETAISNITQVLQSFQEYSLFISILQQTGADNVFTGRQNGQGITIFAPKDSAFNKVAQKSLQGLSTVQRKQLVEYHALTSYFSLDSLKTLSADSSLQTVASLAATSGGFRVNFTTTASGNVTLHSGLTNAIVTDTLSDAKPVSIYSIDAVLLPEDIFGKTVAAPAPAPANSSAPRSSRVPDSPVLQESPPGGSASTVPFNGALSLAIALLAWAWL